MKNLRQEKSVAQRRKAELKNICNAAEFVETWRLSVGQAVQEWLITGGTPQERPQISAYSKEDLLYIEALNSVTPTQWRSCVLTWVEAKRKIVAASAATTEPVLRYGILFLMAVRKQVYKWLACNMRCTVSHHKQTGAVSFVITRCHTRHIEDFQHLVLTNDPTFRREFEDFWDPDKKRPPTILGEDTPGSGPSLLFTGGFETNRSRH